MKIFVSLFGFYRGLFKPTIPAAQGPAKNIRLKMFLKQHILSDQYEFQIVTG